MFILFVCLSHRGHLIGVKLVKMPKHKLVRYFSTDRALYSDKARSFSQSERALYRNFIINLYIEAQTELIYLICLFYGIRLIEIFKVQAIHFRKDLPGWLMLTKGCQHCCHLANSAIKCCYLHDYIKKKFFFHC